MSSVLIKGMEMPDNCQYCPMIRWYPENGNIWCNVIPKLIKEGWYTEIDIKRPEDCPLVEIPPHGRLIDERIAYDKIAEQECGYYMDMDGVDMGLQETPTVIEAEEE